MKFLVITKINGEFAANGVLGLAPTSKENEDISFIHQLYRQGVIQDKVIGLNFEDPVDFLMQSTISVGFVDEPQVVGGMKGFVNFTNAEQDSWTLKLNDLQYNGKDIGFSSPRSAVIDSGNSSIQLPASVFANLKAMLINQDNSITESIIDGEYALLSSKSCDQLEPILSDLIFQF